MTRAKDAVTISQKSAFDVIGSEVRRVDAIDKVTGRARYAADYDRPGQLYGAVKCADHPHARILAIHTEKARAFPGVRAVVTHHDIPGEKSFGTIIPHQIVFCIDKVRYYGDVVAAVAADTQEIAYQAAALIEVDYEPLPVVTDPEAAMAPESPLVHPKGNLCHHHRVRKGDVDAGFAQSDIILTREYSTQKVEHAYLEPEAVIAEPGQEGGITIIGSVQNLYTIRRAVAAVLGLPLNKVRIMQATLGGSFGGKDEAMSALCCRAAILALVANRPVKMVNTREQSMRESYKRHPYKMTYKAGITKDGILQAMEITIYADAGAYAATSPFVTWRSAVQATGPYNVPHVKTDVYAAYTNNCYTGAMRGFGSPQVCFAVESLMDELAEAAGLDPLEIRLRNVFRDGAVTATGQRLNHRVGLTDALLKATESSDFRNLWQKNRQQKSEIRKGIGIACSYRGVSLGAEGTDAAGVGISVQSDGSVVVSTGLVDMGQGAATTISMVVAERLGVTTDKIKFTNADTTLIPDSGPTVASRTSLMAGNAAINGCEQLLDVLRPVAADMLGCSEEAVVFSGNKVMARAGEFDRTKSVEFSEVAANCFRLGKPLFAFGWFKAPRTTWDEKDGQGIAYFTYVYGANLAEVEVDTLTGQVRVTRFVSAHDVGRVLNPSGARGQVYGGVTMGLGYALLEEYAEDQAKPVVSNFDEYLLPTIADVPQMEAIFVENPDPVGPFGAKSLAEPACELAAPAIANAVANALGRHIRQLPLTLEQVAIGQKLRRSGERGSRKTES